VILHTSDGGKTWSKQNGGVALSLEALFFLDAQNGWAVGWAGTVLHTVDGGQKWQLVKIPGASWSLSSITFQDANHGWIVGFAGQLFQTSDGGKTWEARKSGYSGWLTSIGFDGAKRGWITTDNGFLLSEDGGQTWKLQPTDSQLFLNKVLRNTGITWALGPFGLLKQTAGATQWKKIVNPLSSNAAAEDPKAEPPNKKP
jgi:photosystem II stability/assembly factor-like uncharacterized protein